MLGTVSPWSQCMRWLEFESWCWEPERTYSGAARHIWNFGLGSVLSQCKATCPLNLQTSAREVEKFMLLLLRARQVFSEFDLFPNRMIQSMVWSLQCGVGARVFLVLFIEQHTSQRHTGLSHPWYYVWVKSLEECPWSELLNGQQRRTLEVLGV